MKLPERYVLLNPGPVTLTDSVRQSLMGRDMCHREEQFSQLMGDVRQMLTSVYGNRDAWGSVLVTGSGTAAVESMVSSIVEGAKTSLVCANGVYGERIVSMLERAGKPAVQVRSEWNAAIDFEAVEKTLQSTPSIKHVIGVHHETTTGRLNDLDRLATLCARFEKRMLVDGVSSFGGEQIDFDQWPIDAVAATANKCLHGVPGIAFVIARKDLLRGDLPGSSSLYLDLSTNYSAQESGFPAFTPAIQSLFALRQALIELEEEGGWKSRRDTYRKRSETVTETLEQLGISPYLTNAQDRSCVLTAYRLPNSKTYPMFSDPLLSRNIVIYAGQKHLEKTIFRLSFMGDLHDSDLETLTTTIGKVIESP
jgi:2-aminoethylphosphonate-pyruvate transaminase